MLKTAVTSTIALTSIIASMPSASAETMLYEETRAREEEQLIFLAPIAGVENKVWFNYRANVLETKKELSSDLRRASDTEDLRDAWDEYADELRHERRHYVKKMEKRGFRQGNVIIG